MDLYLGGEKDEHRLRLENYPFPILHSRTHASRLCNRAEEYGHARSSECDRRTQASALE